MDCITGMSKRGVKGDCEFLGLHNWKNGVVVD